MTKHYRYFRTVSDWLWFRWDGESMDFTGTPGSSWSNDGDGDTFNPDTLNHPSCGDEFAPSDPMYAYETDRNFVPLPDGHPLYPGFIGQDKEDAGA